MTEYIVIERGFSITAVLIDALISIYLKDHP